MHYVIILFDEMILNEISVCVLVDVLILMKRKFKQRLATIPPIPTKSTIPFHLISLNIKKTSTYVVGNPGPGLGHSLVLNFNQCLVRNANIRNISAISL